MDVTPDNTEDGTKDYAKVFAKTPEGIREFKITTAEAKWGKVGFEYTDQVGWEHKVYEFAIPLKEIATAGTDRVELAFSAYGTMNALNFGTDSNGIDPNSGSSGTTFTFTVIYDAYGDGLPPQRSDVWIDINGDAQEGAGPVAFPLGGVPPSLIVVFFVAAVLALLLISLRKKLGRAALVVLVAAALWSCPSPSLTTQEVYPMTGSGLWSSGVVMTATVDLTPDPGTYNFEFRYKDSTGSDVTTGGALGTHQLTIY